MPESRVTLDGNEAAAYIAYQCNEVIAIYPITPASPMGELADQWAAQGQLNIWRSTPEIIEMQSEGGAAGAIHGALQCGSLTTTFTASQGLLLMLPNMYKIAGELTPAVFHVASRSLAAQALSIFCDHSDVMAIRASGFALLSANSVQEVMDFALIAQAATLQGRIPFVHFFDGFRTSHEIATVDKIDSGTIKDMIEPEWVEAHRQRALSPENPVLRGTAQNPDVYFQARETVNKYYQAMPGIVQQTMERFAELTGRRYQIYEYHGADDAERIIVTMGSSAETVAETVDDLINFGAKVGLLKIRLFRPIDASRLVQSIPSTVQTMAVLDRCKEPGADGEPLYKDVMTAFCQHHGKTPSLFKTMPRIVGGRYGLSSKEFTPAMVKGIFDELATPDPKNGFTVGINDDVGLSSLTWDSSYRTQASEASFNAVFFGLGSDGTVSANKNAIKIIGKHTQQYVQGYFVYDSKKAGAVTVSHLRFGADKIRSSYLIQDGQANFIACHQSQFIERYTMLAKAADDCLFLFNTPLPRDQVWESLPQAMQATLLKKRIRFYVIDAYQIALQCGLGRHINTVMQVCFFALNDIMPLDDALAAIKEAIERTYAKAGRRIIQANLQAVDAAVSNLHHITLPSEINIDNKPQQADDEKLTPFQKNITLKLLAGEGDSIPVSCLPADGTFPTGTAALEKRNLALEIPVWETDLCTQCGKCVFVCPHSCIRSKIFTEKSLEHAPAAFKSTPVLSKAFAGHLLISYQVAAEDCTGCNLCVQICPIRDPQQPERKALNMATQSPLREQERRNWDFFLTIPEVSRVALHANKIPEAMHFQPLFEFSGACAGCGETPYIRLASQLFGERMIVANATGCSSIYGGNLPTTPWSKNADGRGPAWSNSLFEDNAEFGLGMRIAVDAQRRYALQLLQQMQDALDINLVHSIVTAQQHDEAGIYAQRQRVETLKTCLLKAEQETAKRLLAVADTLIKRSVWIIGGDGWGYDIGYGGLDHVLASGKDVNILLLDTEVYSNTGGQTSKATPRGAVAKFSADGKATAKKDLARLAIDYEQVYVAQVAFGAKDTQTLHAFLEAESYSGVSLILAYSPCIAHGVDLSNNIRQQQMAVRSGHWPLLRYDPRRIEHGKNPLQLDYREPSIAYRDFAMTEARFSVLSRSHPESSASLLEQAQQDVDARYAKLKQQADMTVHDPSNKEA